MKPIRVLFLCTGNSARSVIGAALLKQMGGGALDVHSAGINPKGINPYTLQVLSEAGIDASAERSKHVSEYEGQQFDYVITVCDDAAEHCPLFPGDVQRIHWSLRDPSAADGTDEEKFEAFRSTLRELRERITGFIAVSK
jgi:arsenate reductase